MFRKIGIIGTGNMGSAIIRSVRAGHPDLPLLLSDAVPEKALALAESLKGAETAENTRLAQSCDLIFLAVKPQMMKALLSSLHPVLSARKDRFVLASMAAGLSCETLRAMAGFDVPLIRMMPNIPCQVGEGVVQYCGCGTTEQELSDFALLLRAAGLVTPMQEGLIDAASAVSGCGPAYVYLFIEALADGGVACGLPRKTAQDFAAQTVLGAAKMVLKSGVHPAELKDRVCSPGGTTIEGVAALYEGAFSADVMRAVTEAYRKTLEMKG